MKTYECACPVCHQPTQHKASFLSTRMTYRVDKEGNKLDGTFPAILCQGKHTLKEVRLALNLSVGSHENPDRIV